MIRRPGCGARRAAWLPREAPTATLLPNGQVLVAGGWNTDFLASAELYTSDGVGEFTLESSFSRKTDRHNSFDVPLPGVEDRSDGKRFVIGFTFNNEVTRGPTAQARTARNNRQRECWSSHSHALLVTFNGQTCNQQEVTLTLTNVHDTLGNTLASAETSGCFLIGDVNGDGHVGNGDIGNIQGHLGEITDESNFRDDINADGRINNQDVQAARSETRDLSVTRELTIRMKLRFAFPVETTLNTSSGLGEDAYPGGLLPPFRPAVAGKSQGKGKSKCINRFGSRTARG